MKYFEPSNERLQCEISLLVSLLQISIQNTVMNKPLEVTTIQSAHNRYLLISAPGVLKVENSTKMLPFNNALVQ